MKASAKVFNALTIIFAVVFIAWLSELNYSDLSFKENRNAYFGMISVLMSIFAIQMIKGSIKKAGDKDQKKEKE